MIDLREYYDLLFNYTIIGHVREGCEFDASKAGTIVLEFLACDQDFVGTLHVSRDPQNPDEPIMRIEFSS